MSLLKEKKLPVRKCSGCGEHFPKNSLIRVLRTPEGEIVLDTERQLSGRGAYICKSPTCLKKAKKSLRIDRSLKCTIPEKIYEKLEEEIRS